MIGDLPVLFPYDRIYPGERVTASPELASYSTLRERQLTPSRAVLVHVRSQGDARCRRTLCARNAFGDRQDGLAPQSDCVVHAGESCRLRVYQFTDRLTRFQFYPIKRKLIYCSRTVPEIEKALAELKRLMEYRAEMGAHDEEFRGLGLTSRKNLCLHPEVSDRCSGLPLPVATGTRMEGFADLCRSARRKRERLWIPGVGI
jgi:hypothetical protein